MGIERGMVKPEPLILPNSHDGTSSYRLMSGVLRIVRRNGLIVSEGEARMIRVPHEGDIIGKVTEGAYRIIEDTRSIAESLDEIRQVTLAPAEQEAFAEAAPLREGQGPGRQPARGDGAAPVR